MLALPLAAWNRLSTAVAERDAYKVMLVQVADFCDDGQNWPHGIDGDESGSWTTCDGRFNLQQLAEEAVDDYQRAAREYAQLNAVWTAARRYKWCVEHTDGIADAEQALFKALEA
jgi:hypothetical protein